MPIPKKGDIIEYRFKLYSTFGDKYGHPFLFASGSCVSGSICADDYTYDYTSSKVGQVLGRYVQNPLLNELQSLYTNITGGFIGPENFESGLLVFSFEDQQRVWCADSRSKIVKLV